MDSTNEPIRRYRPRLTFYHPNSKGTGCAMQMELHPAHDDTDGSIMMSMANQLTVGNRMGSSPTFPTFDWENKLTVKLDFADLSRMLQVFRGECESLEDGRGIYHRTSSFSTKIQLRHLLEPVCGYSIELFRNSNKTREDAHAHILLSSSEALGLSSSIENSLGVICFGIPMVIPHDTSAYRREQRGQMRSGDATAA